MTAPEAAAAIVHLVHACAGRTWSQREEGSAGKLNSVAITESWCNQE